VNTVVQHTTEELRKGLRCVVDGATTPELRDVEDELRLAGFLVGAAGVTPAGQRFLGAAPGDTYRISDQRRAT
jgi:hypothetical protein